MASAPMMFSMAQIKDELLRWNLRIIDLEQQIAQQKRCVASDGGKALGSLEALRFMKQTLENWRAHRRALQRRL
jgi:hypothetical protein